MWQFRSTWLVRSCPLLLAMALLIAALGGCKGGATAAGPQNPSEPAGSGSASSAGVVTYPALPGAVRSPLYAVTANGTALFVEKFTKFAPEMQVP